MYEKALEATLALVAKSQTHEGCLGYDVFESGTRPDVFAIIETWESQDAKYVPIIQECGELKIEIMEK
mgnify:CR=1 FL=1